MASEIRAEKDEESPHITDAEAKKLNIMRIIKYQKSLYYSSSSWSSFSSTGAASCSSFSSPRKSSSLLELMKEGSTSLRRLFDMEHTSLETYLRDYSCSPIVKPIFLWGSDTDDGIHDDPWMSIKQARAMDSQSGLALDDSTPITKSGYQNKFPRFDSHRRLSRTRSFKRLPRFRIWFCGGFRFRLRLRRLRVIISRRKL